MEVSIPLHSRLLKGTPRLKAVQALFETHYQGEKLVRVLPPSTQEDMGGYLAANTLAGKVILEILIGGNDDRLMLAARLDNLGKGASGAAVQCLNLMLGTPEYTGLMGSEE